ncbi:MAG: alpha/beta hydrolase [bacterium]|nr:alpha/beta hydrolase [bacterium]
MVLKTIPVQKTARYALLGEPGPHIRDVWFACHGYGQLAAEFINDFAVLDDGRHLVAAPEALHRFYLHSGSGKVGASWMTKEDRLNDINDYIIYLDKVYGEVMDGLDADSVRVNLLGFSQGTATACRWALQGVSRFHRLILWGGDFPPDTDWNAGRERLDNLDIQLVFGENDPYAKPAFVRQLTELLTGRQVNFQVKTSNGHHEIDSAMLKELMKD